MVVWYIEMGAGFFRYAVVAIAIRRRGNLYPKDAWPSQLRRHHRFVHAYRKTWDHTVEAQSRARLLSHAGRYIIDGEKVGSGFAKPASNTTAVFAGEYSHDHRHSFSYENHHSVAPQKRHRFACAATD
jgi:hypothetical protein